MSISDNIILLFQPPYSPEVNPIEKFWKEIKRCLKNQVFNSLDFYIIILTNILGRFSQKDIASITGYEQDLLSAAIYSAFLIINSDIYTTSSAFT